MTTVVIVRNVLDDSEHKRFNNVDNIAELLMQEFAVWPETAKVYHQEIKDDNEITITSLFDIDRLQKLKGTVYIVICPSMMTLMGIGYLAATVAIQVYVRNKKKSPAAAAAAAQRVLPEGSPNNSLSGRSNRERIKGRIPDIYGTVRSTPDLIAPSYRVFEGGSEVEHTLMAIGRGAYLIDDVREDTTLIENISGSFASFYGPNKSPNNSLPDLTINGEYEEPFILTKRSTNVNDQPILAPNTPGFNNTSTGSGAVVQVGGFSLNSLSNSAGDNATLGFNSSNEPVKASFGSTAPPDYQSASYRNRAFISYQGSLQTKIESIVKPYVELTRINRTTRGADATVFSGFFKPGDKVTISATAILRTVTGFQQVQNVAGIPQWGFTIIPTFTTGESYVLNGTYPLGKVADHEMYLRNPENESSIFQQVKDIINSPNYDVTSFLNIGYAHDHALRLYFDSLMTAKIGKDYFFISTGTSITNTTFLSNGGPYIVEDADSIILNFKSAGGLYTDNGTTQTAKSVSMNVSVQPIDLQDEPVGSDVDYTVTMSGSATRRDDILTTFRQDLVAPGRNAITVTRTTNLTIVSGTTASEEIILTDLYEAKPITQSDFGNVTIVRTATLANKTTISQSNRKFNCKVSRLIPIRQTDGTFSLPAVTSRFADIAVAICLDPYIGNRQLWELDIQGWYNLQEQIEAYFGLPIFAQFNHTFDDEDMSFEEMLSIIAECVHCNAYRQGSLIKLSFEKETDNSLILFNHRNKLPGTETRTVSFGNANEKDGVEVEYVDSEDGAVISYYLPEDRTALYPEEIKQYGVQSKLQARTHAYRIWNRIRYQNTVIEFDATQEALLLSLNDRVQVADNTRTQTFDGEVISQNGSLLRLSQPFFFENGKNYTIFLQSINATIQAIPISPGLNTDEIILQSQTTLPLALDFDLFARATYEIVENSSTRKKAFLIEEKSPKDNFVTTLKCINYDSRYYQNDKDFINNIVNENGNPIGV